MAYFGVIIAAQDWFCDKQRLAEDTIRMIQEAGHSCNVWRPEKHDEDLFSFVTSALRRHEPVAIIYMGHGSKYGWNYSKLKLFPYKVLAALVSRYRKGIPTAFINDCCFSGSLASVFESSSFDKENTIALTAGVSSRTSVSGETLKEHHTYRVLKAWFLDKKPFNPFEYNDNVQDFGDEKTKWPHWKREGPERFGIQDIDKHFLSVKSQESLVT